MHVPAGKSPKTRTVCDCGQCHQDVPEWRRSSAHHLPLHHMYPCPSNQRADDAPAQEQLKRLLSLPSGACRLTCILTSTIHYWFEKNDAFWGNHGHTSFVVLPITQKKMQKQCNTYLCLAFNCTKNSTKTIYKVEALANIRSGKYPNSVEQSSLDLDCTWDAASANSEVSWGKLLHILLFTETWQMCH